MKTLTIYFLVIALGFTNHAFCFAAGKDGKEKRIQRKALRIHQKAITIDSHNDTPMWFSDSTYDFGINHQGMKHSNRVDIPRMESGGLDGAFFAVFIGQGERSEAGNAKALSQALKTFDAIKRNVYQNSQKSAIALKASDAVLFGKSNQRAVFIGLENGYPIGRDISNVSRFYQLGARYITLCHTQNNDLCDSSTDTLEHNGVSEFGKSVIAEMNRLGMMVDVSHISDKSFYDVLKICKAPVIASHSCARKICNNPRNLDDDMLRALAENEGVIQMCILSSYVKTPPPYPARDSAFKAFREKYKGFKNLSESEMAKARQEWHETDEMYPQTLATVKDVVDHIDHIVSVAGIRHVGIGTDFDGGGAVNGCENVSEMQNITIELVRRGYSSKQIKLIWGGNLLRVMKKVEKLARQI